MTQALELSRAPATLPAPKEIVVRSTDALVAYACPNPNCGMLFLFRKDDTEEDKRRKRDEAAAHCVKVCACGKPLDYHYFLRCEACRAEKEARREKLAFDNAQKVSIDDYPENSPVFWEGGCGDMEGDGYFSSLSALLDYCEDEGKELPTYVWACRRHDFTLDAAGVVQANLAAQDIDPAGVRLTDSDFDALQKVLNDWIEKQGPKLQAWFQDTNRAVVLVDSESS